MICVKLEQPPLESAKIFRANVIFMSFSYRSSALLIPRRHFALTLFLLFIPLACVLGPVASAEIDSQAGPAPPTALQGVKSAPASKTSNWVLVHVGAALLAGSLISAAALRMKYRRFIGLGVFSNWHSALFLLSGALLCGLPRTSVNTLASLLTPSAASWVADSAGIVLTLMFGMRVRAPKSAASGGTVQDLETPARSNVIFAVIEEGIRDRLLTRMQLVLIEYAERYTWETIQNAGQRTVDEEVAVGRLGRKDGDAAIESIKVLRSPRDRKTDVDRKYRALLHLLSCCPLSRLRGALANAAGGHP